MSEYYDGGHEPGYEPHVNEGHGFESIEDRIHEQIEAIEERVHDFAHYDADQNYDDADKDYDGDASEYVRS
ncbi:hypothetical protein [Dactylosporangium sp. CA-092794]|uniref:hypothetical protein n=1 Tax=Dactylosporangium sp. CA-092794 TaxID=3239929 RepID=UPI003D90931C